MRKLFLLIVLLVASSCATNSHTINSCGGIDIPICEHEVQGARTLTDEIEFQEDKLKQSILRSMNLILDQMIQNIMKGI